MTPALGLCQESHAAAIARPAPESMLAGHAARRGWPSCWCRRRRRAAGRGSAVLLVRRCVASVLRAAVAAGRPRAARRGEWKGRACAPSAVVMSLFDSQDGPQCRSPRRVRRLLARASAPPRGAAGAGESDPRHGRGCGKAVIIKGGHTPERQRERERESRSQRQADRTDGMGRALQHLVVAGVPTRL